MYNQLQFFDYDEGTVTLQTPDTDQQTPLHIACNFGWTKFCELIIKAGASVSFKDKWSSTPLHYASKRGDCQIIQMLLQSIQNKDELNAVGYAYQTNIDIYRFV